MGDVQGCALELSLLLEEAGFRQGADRLFSVGDVVARGPDSAEAVRILKGLSATAVMGNHERHLLKSRPRPLPQDLARAPDREELLAWLRALPVMVVQEDLILVHAGLSPRWADEDPVALAARLNRTAADSWGLDEDADVRFALTVRWCDAAGNPWTGEHDPPPPPPFRPWDDFYRAGRTVVFGHWARRGLVVRPRIRGLDTGCVWGGSLSAWIAEEDRIVQVPARRTYRTPGA